VDWRASRLVDKLAKFAAEAQQASKHIRELLPSADAAVAHAACLLGTVAHAANNCETTATDDSGKVTTAVSRDSSDKPKAKRAGSAPAPTYRASGPKPATTDMAAAAPLRVKPWAPPSAKLVARRDIDAILELRVQEIGAALVPSTALSASSRLALVAARVRARWSAA
jgi:hypothetical protein